MTVWRSIDWSQSLFAQREFDEEHFVLGRAGMRDRRVHFA
jgi:hypothetical protein